MSLPISSNPETPVPCTTMPYSQPIANDTNSQNGDENKSNDGEIVDCLPYNLDSNLQFSDISNLGATFEDNVEDVYYPPPAPTSPVLSSPNILSGRKRSRRFNDQSENITLECNQDYRKNSESIDIQNGENGQETQNSELKNGCCKK